MISQACLRSGVLGHAVEVSTACPAVVGCNTAAQPRREVRRGPKALSWGRMAELAFLRTGSMKAFGRLGSLLSTGASPFLQRRC